MSKENGIASAADFRRAAEAEAFEGAQRVTLPKSGLTVLLRRPRPVFFALVKHGLPQSLASRIAEGKGAEAFNEMTAEELRELAGFWTEVFESVFVSPRVSLTPGPDEISPNLLAAEDVMFLIRWAVGEVASDGRDLAPFRRESGPPAAGASGGDVSPEAVGAPERNGSGLPD